MSKVILVKVLKLRHLIGKPLTCPKHFLYTQELYMITTFVICGISEMNPVLACLIYVIVYLLYRPVQFARPTSGTKKFNPRTNPFCSEQVPRTCLVISQLPVNPQQDMTYQSASTFNKESIPLVCMYFGVIFQRQIWHSNCCWLGGGGSNSHPKRD